MSRKKKELSLQDQLLQTDNMDEVNEIVEMFNVDLQKKNIIRSAKLSEVQDKVVDQMLLRLEERADNFSNDDLIKYHKIVNETLTKTDTTMDNIKTPTIQINQQVNVDSMTFDTDSRKRILAAVHDIMKGDATIVDAEIDEDNQ